MLVTSDARRTARELAAGTLACPRCAGRLAPWGHARERAVRLLGGASARVRPRRARCKACRVSFVLLPAWCAPRRGHAIEVIGTAAAAAAGGYGPQALGSWLGVPEGTVRGWLRRLRVCQCAGDGGEGHLRVSCRTDGCPNVVVPAAA